MAKTVGLPADHVAFTSAEVLQAFARMADLVSESKLVAGDDASAAGVGSLAQDMQDPQSNSVNARNYRGENGQQAQKEAQKLLHTWMSQKR